MHQICLKDDQLARAKQSLETKCLEQKDIVDTLALKHRQDMLEQENALKAERNSLVTELAEARDAMARFRKQFDDALSAKSFELMQTRESLHQEYLSKQQQLHSIFQ